MSMLYLTSKCIFSFNPDIFFNDSFIFLSSLASEKLSFVTAQIFSCGYPHGLAPKYLVTHKGQDYTWPGL